MNAKDPKGYYAILRVSPAASAAEIKVAFRCGAMELHPDRNKSLNATKEFQLLNEAYSVLSEPAGRAQYDTLNIETPKRQTREQEKPPEPIVCSVCGKVTAQPRYAIFYEVMSFILVTKRSPIQGIFCRACAEKKSLRASVVTWLLGWWGFPWGPIFSLHAIFINLLGGERPYDVNARLAAYQAWVFAVFGKRELARAIAMDALDLARKIKPQKVSARIRKALGYGVDDEGTRLRKEIEDLLSALDTGSASIRLNNLWALLGRPFYVQGLIGLTVVGIVWGAIIFDSSQSLPSASLPRDVAPPSSGPTPTHRPTPKPKYVRPEFADNGAPWPITSGYIAGYSQRFADGYSTVTIDNSRNGSDVFVKLYSLNTSPPVQVRIFFVRAFDQFTVRDVRAGRYDVRNRDLDSGALSRSDSFEIEETRTADGVRFSRFTMTLYKVRGGTMRSYPISEAEF